MEHGLRESRIQTVCLLILCAIAVAASLYWLRPVMIPLVLAVFFSLCLSMMAEVLTLRFKFPKVLAMGTTLLIASLFFLLLVTLISSSVRQLANQAGAYQDSLNTIVENIIHKLPLERLGLSKETNRVEGEEPLKPTIADLSAMMKMPLDTIGSLLLSTTNTLLELLQKSVLVLIFVFFLMIGQRTDAAQGPGVLAEIQTRIKRYLLTKAAASAVTGLLVGSILSLLNVDLAIVFGLSAFLLNFIPSIGSIIATLLPLPIILISPENSDTTLILAMLLPGSVQLLIGNFLEPKIQGDSLDLHPVTILVALIFWGMLWGAVGMFLAIPMTAILKILMEPYTYTRPFAQLMAGKFESWDLT